ncbi:MAG: DEAD/DEAH box helicase [Alphaproteobacteria bacterium]|nr:DEAD/DEAH box helicase [Alphaproteobacteria bacterium]
MKAFDFDRQIVGNYAEFSRSFSTIRAADLRDEIDRQYEQGRFWPDALLSLNPHYETGPTVDDLAQSGDLYPETARIFRFDSTPVTFHRHQAQAIAKACAGNSFVVTTGTGSGKSLCFFVPIVDAVIRARKASDTPRTRAIIVYPMNALANSQINEIERFISQSGLPDHLKPVVRRYTGQESRDARERIADNPPDILLTNFMMAELLLTRQDSIDSRIIANAGGLRFIVLDELHTYRGRQGADVAILVRRLRDRCTPDKAPLCIGTSATMASEGDDETRAKEVAEVASRLFGVQIGSESVIDESLRRATDDRLGLEEIQPRLLEAVENELPESLTDADLKTHPLAVWAELALGLEDGLVLKRRRPIPFGEAAERLSQASGAGLALCGSVLETFLTCVSLPETHRGGEGNRAFLAFKLHRFIAGAGEVFATLRAKPRTVLLEGQLEDPNDPGTRLYPVRFCRECGQEHYVVTRVQQKDGAVFLPRDIDDTPIESEDDVEVAGYLSPVGRDDPDYRFDGELENFPEDWTEEHRGLLRLRANRKKRAPTPVTIAGDGHQSMNGEPFWFIPGKFGFCTRCLDEPQSRMRERSKLTGLTVEGRSSATTLLVSSAIRWLNRPESAVPDDKRKLLGFTDNRQDAALQAGHFNDFLFVSILRGATLRAVLDAGIDGVRDDEIGLRVQRALGFTAANEATRRHWMLNPDIGAVGRSDAERSLAKVLAHRVWADLRRGWRFTNPNLSALKLVDVDFLGLDEITEDAGRFGAILPELGSKDHSDRKKVVGILLEAMREGLAVGTEALELSVLDTVAQGSRSFLRAPWAIDDKESIRERTTLFLRAPGKKATGLKEERMILRAGPRSRIARLLNRESVIGTKLGGEDYLRFLTGLLDILTCEGLLIGVPGDADQQGWRLAPSAVRLVPGEAVLDGAARGNPFFHDLYTRIADELNTGRSSLFGMEGREHTAQVNHKQREWREWRFRFEDEDREQLAECAAEIKESGESDQFLPALFCTPTMELGVDISALNVVYLRNVPPTPANYAQRAGRAGRSGQAAAILTYCAAQSPHDQYFFKRRIDMVAGAVRPPALDIANENLVTSHLQAIWLAEAGLALSPDIPESLDLKDPCLPLKQEIQTVVQDPGLIDKARTPMRRVLGRILSSLDERKPLWMDDPDDYVSDVATRAPNEFDAAFGRWRELYRSARRQLIEANGQSQIPGLSGSDRRKIKAAQMQATDQIAILEQGRTANGSDFYSYRYLATEGFLPGYNFPRLPLYAFIPGEGKSGSFLQRPRFLAISEFGPRSLIYHEGRAFRVNKAKLPPEIRKDDGRDLATRDISICPACGAAHDSEVERCHACNAPMAGALSVKRTLRIDNVEAVPTERITANDEERVRQGFELQTVFAWPKKHGRADFTQAEFRSGNSALLSLQYANSAEIRRINKGLKRRHDATVLGFMIDPRTGYWAKTEDEDLDTELPPDVERPVRIVPIVQDRKNALLLRFQEPERFDPVTITTVQHAILRGIALAFQLEEGEVLGEPLPARDNRRAILAYEATEGGAGVLSRLIEDPEALNRVAVKALELMHFNIDSVETAVEAGDPGLLVEREEEACVRGCYRCLLSYFNQPDHEMIDRTSPEVQQLLIDLARGQVVLTDRPTGANAGRSWPDIFIRHGAPAPDAKPLTFADVSFPFVWRSHYVAAKSGAIPEEAETTAHDKGWSLFELPADSSDGLPSELIDALSE